MMSSATWDELRAVFDDWNKDLRCLSWGAFYEKYHTHNINDIHKPDNIDDLRLKTGEFEFLLDIPEDITGNRIDYCKRRLFSNDEDIARKKILIEESNSWINIIQELISKKEKTIASKTAVIESKQEMIEKHRTTIEQIKEIKDPEDIKRLDKDIQRLDNQIDDIRAAIKRLDNQIDDIRAEINDIRAAIKQLDEKDRSLKSVKVGVLRALRKLGQYSNDYTFTNVFDIGMVGRDKELYEVLEMLAKGSGTAVKEDNKPIAIISAPRQGKSLFLQAILALLCPDITRRPLGIENSDKHPTLPANAVVIPLTLNGTSAEVPKRYTTNANTAAKYLWSRVFGIPDIGVSSGESAAWVLGQLFPGRQVVLLVDELSKLAEGFRTNEEELKTFAHLILSFFGTHTTMIFTGFDVKLSSAFYSASGRCPTNVTLDPIIPDTVSFLELLPLRNLLTSISISIRAREPEQASKLLLYYELGKSTPGVLGAVAEQKFDGIPILRMLEDKQLLVEPQIYEYAWKRAQGLMVTQSDALGEGLLSDKIGVLLHGGSVYIPPIFAYASLHKASSTPFQAAFNEVVSVVTQWLNIFLRAGTTPKTDLIQEVSDAFELFVLASLRMQDTLLRPHNTHMYPVINTERCDDSRLKVKYPEQPLPSGMSVSGTWLAVQYTKAVDIVRVVDDTQQQWVEVKIASYRPSITKLVNSVREHMKNVPTGVTLVEYVIVTPVPSKAKKTENPLPETMEARMAELCNLLGDDEDVRVDGRTVRLTKRIVFMNTPDADTFLSPLVATIAPSLGAMNGDTCENVLLSTDTSPDWMAIRENTDLLPLDAETRARLPIIRKRCETAIVQAQTLQGKY